MAAQVQIAVDTVEGSMSSSSKNTVLLTDEDHQAFNVLSIASQLELHPTGPVERPLFSQIVLAAWNMERANRLEATLAASSGVDPLVDGANAKTLDRIAIFRMRAERAFHKCFKELQLYQLAHPLEEPVPQNEAISKLWNEPKVMGFAFKRDPYVRPAPKIGRCEPCPCHSGRKYKSCCLRNEPNCVIPATSPAVQVTRSCTGTL